MHIHISFERYLLLLLDVDTLPKLYKTPLPCAVMPLDTKYSLLLS